MVSTSLGALRRALPEVLEGPENGLSGISGFCWQSWPRSCATWMSGSRPRMRAVQGIVCEALGMFQALDPRAAAPR